MKKNLRKQLLKFRAIISLIITAIMVGYFSYIFNHYHAIAYETERQIKVQDVKDFIEQIDFDIASGNQNAWDLTLEADRNLVAHWVEKVDQRPGTIAVLTDLNLNVMSKRFGTADIKFNDPFDDSDEAKEFKSQVKGDSGEVWYAYNGYPTLFYYQAVPSQNEEFYIFVAVGKQYYASQIDETPFQLGLGVLVLTMIILNTENVILRWKAGKFKNGK